jgi:hypothetical protein
VHIFLQPKIENDFIMAVPLEVQKSVDHILDEYHQLLHLLILWTKKFSAFLWLMKNKFSPFICIIKPIFNWGKRKMKAEYGHFSSDWEKMSDKPLEYRKKIGAFEMIATEEEEFCKKCKERSMGFSYRTLDSRGDKMKNSEVFWCSMCGEGMIPEAYESFVKSELITPEEI